MKYGTFSPNKLFDIGSVAFWAFLGAILYLDAVLFLYSLIKDELICALSERTRRWLKFSPILKLAGSLISEKTNG